MHDKFGDRWVVSNVNITAQDEVTGREVERLLGNRMRRFTTEQGRKVVAFGPLFDFKGASPAPFTVDTEGGGAAC